MLHNLYPTMFSLAVPTTLPLQAFWGSAPPAANVQVILSATREDTFNLVFYEITVKAQPVVVLVPLQGSTAQIQVPKQPLRITARQSMSAFANTAGDLHTLLLHRISPLVYEADPRIGSCEQSYAPLPLFDPPLGIAGMRQISGCALCGITGPDPEGAGYRAWGGGNIGWVHPTCLVRVYT
jgi:hypothetical protein